MFQTLKFLVVLATLALLQGCTVYRYEGPVPLRYGQPCYYGQPVINGVVYGPAPYRSHLMYPPGGYWQDRVHYGHGGRRR